MENKEECKNEIIKLNVGGVMFQTTKLILLKEDTMLSTMVSTSIPTTKDENGYIQLKRSGKFFGAILGYLKDKKIPILRSFQDIDALEEEADYYLIDELKKCCQRRRNSLMLSMLPFNRQKLLMQIRSIFNRLTAIKYVNLRREFFELDIKTDEDHIMWIELVIGKAQNEPLFCKIYAKLCCDYFDNRDPNERSEKLFLRNLLTYTEHSFLNPSMYLEDDSNKDIVQRQWLGFVTFLGEILKLKYLSLRIISEIIKQRILSKCEIPEMREISLECLCKMLKASQYTYEKCYYVDEWDKLQQSGRDLETYYDQVKRIINEKDISIRVKYMLQDLIDELIEFDESRKRYIHD